MMPTQAVRIWLRESFIIGRVCMHVNTLTAIPSQIGFRAFAGMTRC